MIHYALVCENAHAFEGWFANSAAFDEQSSRGHVQCPDCGSSKVTKAPMAPRIARGADRVDVLQVIRRVREHVAGTSDYVGDKFASEALKIHHEEVEPRGIYGEATKEEVEELHQEGVEFYPLPTLPEDHN